MVFKEVKWGPDAVISHEEIPKSELWEDGELSNVEVQQKILNHTMQQGDWLLVRRVK
jgi:hypothetical protein